MLDLVKTPMSYKGSYMALAYYKEGQSYHGIVTNPQGDGLYLKSVKGKSRHCTASLKIIPQIDGNIEEYEMVYDFHELKLKNNNFEIKICFIDDSKIIIDGQGKGLSIVLDSLPQSMYDYSFELNDGDESYYVVNSYKTQTKYFISSNNTKKLHQKYASDMQGTLESKIEIKDNHISLVIQDIPTHLNKREKVIYDYEKYSKDTKKEFEAYASQFEIPVGKYAHAYKEAIYTTWSCTVKPEGLLARNATYMSNTFFPGVWSRDNCFNTIGLVGADNQLAYDNMMIVFDFQDEYGQLPGSVNDSNIHWNFAKPPIHGLFIEKMMKKMSLDNKQYVEIYEKLYKQINYWLTYHDCNHDGIPEYHHGNDSGYDNSTVFINGFVVDSPDLTAYLIRGLETLENIGEILNKDIQIIKSQKEKLIQLFKEHFIINDHIVARDTVTQDVIECDSILPYVSLIIAKYLPETLVQKMIKDLKENFVTDYGLATEKTTSIYYDPDGYWRGPIWAPEMVILIDALEEVGEESFSKDLVERFLDIMTKEGFAENFNALDGHALRDPAHTWTSSSYIYLVNKYNKMQ